MSGRNAVLFGCLFWAVCFHLKAQIGRPWRLTSDSLLLFSGKTYRYTVDTQEGKGLVSTLPSVEELLGAISVDRKKQCRWVDLNGNLKAEGTPENGDCLQLMSVKGTVEGCYKIGIQEAALPPVLKLGNTFSTVGISQDIVLDFCAGQRTPMSDVDIFVPMGIDITLDNTFVDIIGRGFVLLRDLSKQSTGRAGTLYPCKKVGDASVQIIPDKGTMVHFTGLDLRPKNGSDIRMLIKGVVLPEVKDYCFTASYRISQPVKMQSPVVATSLHGVPTISDFVRSPYRRFYYTGKSDYSIASFAWTPVKYGTAVEVLYSVDGGSNWQILPSDMYSSDSDGQLNVSHLLPNQLYAFKLRILQGDACGDSNIAWFYTGDWDVAEQGIQGTGLTDDTDKINELIAHVADLGGGVIRFSRGIYSVRTLHLKSNVWLYIDSEAVIQALPNGDAPEMAWFSDRAYRSGLSTTDICPYKDPENYLTKQDVGHTFFQNAMFYGERIENVKIVGTGRITGNGNLVTTDKVMNNVPSRRCDKMFAFKLCKDVEIGGINSDRDMWYDAAKDCPYYILDGNDRDYSHGTMLHIDQAGHFVLLATGTDGINVHDTFFGKHDVRNARDIYDFMGCNDVHVQNIYSKVSSDDIVKLGSDCSLGFTRPASDYEIRNIVGDTNCNLFQIGSETADDIQNVYIDNIYVLGANKAGFSISVNDGGHIKNVYLNSGKTGVIHSRSVMKRTRAPFFISISNRGRVLGAEAKPFVFIENGMERKELLITNVNIGKVENVFISGVDISEVYGGSAFRSGHWKPYDGTQHEAASIITGYKLPDSGSVRGGLTFHLQDNRHVGYIQNIQFVDIHLTVKGGHPGIDKLASPPEMGVGRYNVGDLKIQPAFGFWFRHASEVRLDNCTVETERHDARHAVYLDDVSGAVITGLKIKNEESMENPVKTVRSRNIVIQ